MVISSRFGIGDVVQIGNRKTAFSQIRFNTLF